MRILVEGFRAVERAAIDSDGLILVGARNHGGKTSICRAVAAALTGHGVPFVTAGNDGKLSALLNKSEAGSLVRAGTDSGRVLVGFDADNCAMVEWPSAATSSRGEPPVASAIAAGLVSLLDLKEKARATAFAALLGAEPTADDIKQAFSAAGVDDDRIATLTGLIKENGWELTHKKAADFGAKKKGQWEVYAGSKYGSDKAAKFVPEHWTEELAACSEDALVIAVANAKQVLETALQGAAVGDQEIARLEKLAGELPAAEQILAELRETQVKIDEEWNNAAAKRPPAEPATPASMDCPHCKAAVRLEGGKLVKATAKKKAPAAADVAALATLKNEIEELGRRGKAVNVEIGKAEAYVTEKADARDALAAIRAKPAEAAVDVDQCRQAVTVAEQRLAAFSAKTNADAAHTSVVKNQKLIDLLAPDGLRLTKMRKSIEKFNTEAAKMCAAAGFKTVTLGEDMEIRYGGRLLLMRDDSEWFRANVILQLMAAFADGSDMVVIDRCDILDATGRNGLFTLLGKLEMPALVALTANKPDLLPDLATAGLGVTYYVKDGVAQTIAQIKAAA